MIIRIHRSSSLFHAYIYNVNLFLSFFSVLEKKSLFFFNKTKLFYMYNYDQCRLSRVVVSFFLLLHDWTNEREYYTSGSALFSSDYLLLLLYSLTFVYCCLSLIYSLLFICSLSSIQFFFLRINRSLLYCESTNDGNAYHNDIHISY